MTNHSQAYVMDQWESVHNFSKHSEIFHKLYNIKFYNVEMVIEGLALMLQLETIAKTPYLEV